jgi:hypothetical protein
LNNINSTNIFSSSSCPNFSKNRELAKAARLALKQRLIAVDDAPEPKRARRERIDSALADPLVSLF